MTAVVRQRDAAGADQASAVVRAPEPDDLDVSSGLRRVHHPSAPEVEADVPEPLEEEDVARLHAPLPHPAPLAVQRIRAVREIDSDPSVRPAHEARAVEATRRRLAAPAIRRPDGVECIPHRQLGPRRHGDVGRALARDDGNRLPSVTCCRRAREEARRSQSDDEREHGQADAGGGRHREGSDGRADVHDEGARGRPGLSGSVTAVLTARAVSTPQLVRAASTSTSSRSTLVSASSSSSRTRARSADVDPRAGWSPRDPRRAA